MSKKRAKPRKRSGRKAKPSVKPSARRPQPHGGVLVAGAGGGPQPGSGRPPSAVRAASRAAYDARIPLLAMIADKRSAQDKDRIAAIRTLGTFGLSGNVSADDVRARLLATLAEIRACLPTEKAEDLIARIRSHWMTPA